AYRTVETVVIGQGQGGQPGGGTGGHEFLGVGGPVEEAEMGMHVQFRPLHARGPQPRSAARPRTIGGRTVVSVATVGAAGPDRDPVAVGTGERRGIGAVRVPVDGWIVLALEPAGQLRPGGARVRESHRRLLLSSICLCAE